MNEDIVLKEILDKNRNRLIIETASLVTKFAINNYCENYTEFQSRMITHLQDLIREVENG